MSHSCCGSCNCQEKKKENFFKSFAKMSNDSKIKTIAVALILCLLCSFAVSLVAVSLKPIQNKNNQDYKEKNMLIAAGLPVDNPASFDLIDKKWIDVETGDFITDKASGGKPAFDKDNPRYQQVYFVNNDQGVAEKIIVPFGGKGAWGPINGFLVVYRKVSSYYKMPYNEIANVLFYEQSETPGLGGKIEEPEWRYNWQHKEMYDRDGNLVLDVVKHGFVSDDVIKSKYLVDGLSGATVTTGYASKFTRLRLGDKGYKKFFAKLRSMEQQNDRK
ncbi:MAG: FMN-binding protein [Alphaproteobacteria bacterium]